MDSKVFGFLHKTIAPTINLDEEGQRINTHAGWFIPYAAGGSWWKACHFDSPDKDLLRDIDSDSDVDRRTIDATVDRPAAGPA
jgi:hypothetical protein